VVNYEILVPTTLDATVFNINGNVDIEDVWGRTRVDLTNGNIDAYYGSAPDGAIELSTVNGNLRLEIPKTTSATFSASVVNGNISVRDLQLSDIATTPTRTTGVLGNGDGTIELETVNGNIDARGHD
jgi:DUF4097 and DUF4098 domain-containing protein YvlB